MGSPDYADYFDTLKVKPSNPSCAIPNYNVVGIVKGVKVKSDGRIKIDTTIAIDTTLKITVTIGV